MTGWSESLEGRRSNGSSRDALTLSVDFVTMRSNPSYHLASMRTVLFRSSASLLLLAVILMLGGAMSASVAHDLQHAAHHTATSHSTGICAWMCAAGGVAQQSWPSLEHALSEAEPPTSVPDRKPAIHLVTSLTPRAPPIPVA